VLKRKYVVLLMLALVSIVSGGLLYSNVVHANPIVKGYVSISPAEFTPEQNGQTWYKTLERLIGNGSFYTSLKLPNGVTITNMTAKVFDFVSDGQVTVWLVGWNLTANLPLDGAFSRNLAFAQTSMNGTPGTTVLYDDTIYAPTIDNENGIYALMVVFTYRSWDLSLKGFQIEYEYEAGAVGGFWVPVDKFSLLAPYIALVSTIILAVSISGAYIKYRKKQ